MILGMMMIRPTAPNNELNALLGFQFPPLLELRREVQWSSRVTFAGGTC